jgi:hypothetical protein
MAAATPASAQPNTRRTLHVTALNYLYHGVPRELDAPTYTYSFRNRSKNEDHEIGFFRLNDADTTTRAVQDEIADIIATTPPGQQPDPNRITLFDL